MALTSLELEELSQRLSRGDQTTARQQTAVGLNQFGQGLVVLDDLKTDLDQANADGVLTPGQQITYNDWEKNLREVVLGIVSYKTKSSLDALAQMIRDFSIQGGVEGGANELRLYVGGVEHPTDP